MNANPYTTHLGDVLTNLGDASDALRELQGLVTPDSDLDALLALVCRAQRAALDLRTDAERPLR